MAKINRPPFNITYGERPGSPEESYINDTARVRRVIDVPWQQRWEAMAALIGYSTAKTQGATRYISRSIPDQYPDAAGLIIGPGDNWLWASQIERVEGIGPLSKDAANAGGDPQNVFAYETARITVIYESFTYNVQFDGFVGLQGAGGLPDESTLTRYVTKAVMPTAEFLTLPFGAFRFVDANKTPVVGSNGRLLCSQEIQYTWHKVPGTAVGLGYVGTINDAVFDEYNAGTLLLTAAERRPYRQIDGTLIYDYTYKMKYFEPEATKGHNYFLQYKQAGNAGAATYSYTLITSDGTNSGQTVYAEKPFTDLFKIQ